MTQVAPADLPPEIRDMIERYMGDRERCMPSEREALEKQGFVAKVKNDYAAH